MGARNLVIGQNNRVKLAKSLTHQCHGNILSKNGTHDIRQINKVTTVYFENSMA